MGMKVRIFPIGQPNRTHGFEETKSSYLIAVALQTSQVPYNSTEANIFSSIFVRSTGTSPTREESSDLISFSSPTSKHAPKEPHVQLKEYIDQIHK